MGGGAEHTWGALMIRCSETAPGEFELSGRVDVTSVADLRAALQEVVDSATPLAAYPGAALRIDVADLELVDAAGLGALVAAHRRARRAGLGFALVNVPDPLSRLLFISRLYRVLSVEKPAVGAPLEDLRGLAPRPRQSVGEGSSALLA
jgi:anti-sigma B factor antagonist